MRRSEKGRKKGERRNVWHFRGVLLLQVGVAPQGDDGEGGQLRVKDALDQGLPVDTGFGVFRLVEPKLQGIFTERQKIDFSSLDRQTVRLTDSQRLQCFRESA